MTTASVAAALSLASRADAEPPRAAPNAGLTTTAERGSSGSPALHGSGLVTAEACRGCHRRTAPTIDLAVASVAPARLVDLSPYAEWSSSLEALSSRDPIFQAHLESERARRPELAAFIDDTCYGCHAPMGVRQLRSERGDAEPFGQAAFTADLGPDGELGELARDGVSCVVCHRISAEGLGSDASFGGRFKLGAANKIFGPFTDVTRRPMLDAVGVAPVGTEVIKSSKLCGSCHTATLPILQAGRRYSAADARKVTRRAEIDTTYLEWRNSAFQDEANPRTAQAARCQDCHMPRDFRERALELPIASPVSGALADASELALPVALSPRRPYARHALLASNVFVLEMLRQSPESFGLGEGEPAEPAWEHSLDLALAETASFARTKTATIAIRSIVPRTYALEVTLEVRNLTGHKLPTGVGFRRAFLEVLAVDDAGKTVWGSGMTSPTGELVDLAGRPLATERSKFLWQRHWDLIDTDQKVQIYESRAKEGRGPLAELTTSFFSQSQVVKDNRLMPVGWRSDGPFAQRTEPVEVLKADSPGYFDGSGSHTIRYRVPVHLLGRVRRIEVTLFYQSIPPYYLSELAAAGGDGPASRTLAKLLDTVSFDGTPAAGWKLALARASARIR